MVWVVVVPSFMFTLYPPDKLKVGAKMLSVSVVVWVSEPETPVRVSVVDPTLAALDAVNVSVL